MKKDDIEGYDLEKIDEYYELCNSAEVCERAKEIFEELVAVIKLKSDNYGNSIMKSNCLSLYWDFFRKWKRIKRAFSSPFIRRLDILLGRSPEKINLSFSDDFNGKIDSLIRTFKDNANYSILGVIFLEQYKERFHNLFMRERRK